MTSGTARLVTLAGLALLVVLGLVALWVPDSGGSAPRLVVVFVVDQLRTDYIERFDDHYQGGLAWLLERGAYFPQAAYQHAATVTSAGHATISTGLHPRDHGIVGNSWYEQKRGNVYSVEDKNYPAVGGPGDSRSPRALLADTLGDRLKTRYPNGRVYSVSTKDRSAILLAGKRADGAFWFEPDCGCLVTSSFYGERLPAWMAEFNAAGPVTSFAGRSWERLLNDEGLYESLARRDEFATEGDGVATVFPHGLPREDFESKLAATPFSDEITLAAAHAALRSGELGTDNEPDLLALGLSATDSVGHRYGPFSQEAMDNHLRLDLGLGRLIEVVDEVVGLEHAVFALSADHGAVPLVEYLQEQGTPAERVATESLLQGARAAIDDCGAGPSSETVAYASGTRLYWDEQVLADRGLDLTTSSECVADWLRARREVDAVWTPAQLASPEAGTLEERFANGFRAARSAHVQIHLRPYFYPRGPRGTGHGSAHAYDRRVPVLLAGSGIERGRHNVAAGPVDIAPTLAALLRLEDPARGGGRILNEALVRGPR